MATAKAFTFHRVAYLGCDNVTNLEDFISGPYKHKKHLMKPGINSMESIYLQINQGGSDIHFMGGNYIMQDFQRGSMAEIKLKLRALISCGKAHTVLVDPGVEWVDHHKLDIDACVDEYLGLAGWMINRGAKEVVLYLPVQPAPNCKPNRAMDHKELVFNIRTFNSRIRSRKARGDVLDNIILTHHAVLDDWAAYLSDGVSPRFQEWDKHTRKYVEGLKSEIIRSKTRLRPQFWK